MVGSEAAVYPPYGAKGDFEANLTEAAGCADTR